MRYVTESDIEYHNAFLQPDRFKILNMGKEIWFVDIQHSKYKEILKTALIVAQTFHNSKDIKEVEALINCA